jgi:hypothetical protein
MAVLGWMLAVAALTAPFAVVHYLNRLPYAPECPHCRAVTAQAAQVPGWCDRACAAIAATPVRSCTRCGWSGRMRWRWATQHAHRGGHQR